MSEPMTEERLEESNESVSSIERTCLELEKLGVGKDALAPVREWARSNERLREEIRRLREVERNLRETSKIALSIVEEERDRLREANEKHEAEVKRLRDQITRWYMNGAIDECLAQVGKP